MRTIGVVIHHWAGLLTALFLLISGLTGMVISWDHEIDEWLNAHLFEADTTGPGIPYLELAARIETVDPRVRVSNVPLQTEPGLVVCRALGHRSGDLAEAAWHPDRTDGRAEQLLTQFPCTPVAGRRTLFETLAVRSQRN